MFELHNPFNGLSIKEAVGRGQNVDQIAAAIRSLLLPTSSLYYACNQERLRAKKEKVASLENALRETFQKGFSAAVALRSLQEPSPSHSGDYSSIVTNFCGDSKK